MEALFGRFVDPRTVGGEEITLGRKVSARVMHAGTPREKKSEPLAALDVTFSPSKSVSALWAATQSIAIRDALQGAHDFRESHRRTPTRNESAQLKDRATIQSRQRKAGGISDLHAEWRSDLSQAELDEIDDAVNRVASDAVTGGHSARGGLGSTSTPKSPS